MPRLKRATKRRIDEAIPSWLQRWAEQGLKTGAWDELARDPDANIFVLLDFIGVEQEVAEGIMRLVDSGDLSVRDDAEFNYQAAARLMEQVSADF
jgi:hypothetical protein